MLRFGLYLGTQRAPGSNLAASIAADIDLARFVDGAGWDSVWKGQHFLLEDTVGLQPAPVLARLAGEVENVSLGVAVLLLALHNPVDVAETYATVDQLCGGRLLFGAGLGYRDREYAAFGFDRRSRARRFEQNLQALTALWAGETVDLDLPWCRVEGARALTRPVQQPRPPIWLGGATVRGVRRAAELGDVWIIGGRTTYDDAADLAALYASTREQLGRGRPPELALVRDILCCRDRAKALETAGRVPGLVLPTVATSDGAGDDTSHMAALRESGFIVGSVEDCVEQLDAWIRGLGVNHFVLRGQWIGIPEGVSVDSIRLLSEEVIPLLRERYDASPAGR